MTALKHTALHQQHIDDGAKMCPFAGYEMPIQYKLGVLNEHEWVRNHAGLFDVSHMGQVILEGNNIAQTLGKLTPSSFAKTPISRAKYTVLTNEEGGIIDDLIITRTGEERFFAVLNAGCKDKDMAWITSHLEKGQTLTYLDDRALIALQGPEAAELLALFIDGLDIDNMPYMTMAEARLKQNGATVFVSRLGYTGEDGFEISVHEKDAANLWKEMTDRHRIEPIGLGARDSLRLEMGYPLYGHDIDDTTSPIEADLGWVVGKTHTGFIGETRIAKEKEHGTARKRVGVKLLEKGIAREESEITDAEGNAIGTLTSGSFSPSLKTAIGQGYVPSAYATHGTSVCVKVRNRLIAAEICDYSFVEAKTVSSKLQQVAA